MRRFSSLFEILKFPLKVLLIAYVVMGLGMLIQNDNFAVFYTINNSIILMLSEVMVRLGSFVVVNFPMLIIIKLVSRKVNSSVPIIMSIVGYAVYLIVTMVFASPSLPASAFSNILNINYNAGFIPNDLIGIRYPIQTGLIAAFVVGFCTRFSYRQSRSYPNVNFLGVIDRDSLATLLNILYCGLAGFIIALIWPFIYSGFNSFMDFIASDITNPLSLFLYGISDRVLSILDMNNLLRLPFWFGNYGGTMVTLTGETLQGDVTIWSMIQASGVVPTGFGRLITPFYILNMFAMPGLIVGFYSLYSGKVSKAKYLAACIIAIVISVFTGILLPIEMMLLFLAPFLLVIHLIYTGGLFAILQLLNVSLGFTLTNSLNTSIAMPGTLFDFAIHLRNPDMQTNLITIAIVGVITFFVYLFTTRIFFKYLAFDIFQTGETKIMIDNIVQAMGGVDNISEINATPFKVMIDVHDTSVVHRELLLTTKASKVREHKNGFVLVCGKNSVMIRNLILKRIKESKR